MAYLSYQVADDEAACPTTAETAHSFGTRTHHVRFMNDGATTATIYYVNSEREPIGSIRLKAGDTMYMHKRRIFHKFYASSADVFGCGGYCIR